MALDEVFPWSDEQPSKTLRKPRKVFGSNAFGKRFLCRATFFALKIQKLKCEATLLL
jgi:hypothetical protein